MVAASRRRTIRSSISPRSARRWRRATRWSLKPSPYTPWTALAWAASPPSTPTSPRAYSTWSPPRTAIGEVLRHPPRRRHGHLHRLDRRRPADHGGRPPHHQAACSSSWAASRPASSSTTPTSRPGVDRRCSPCAPTPARAAPTPPACSSPGRYDEAVEAAGDHAPGCPRATRATATMTGPLVTGPSASERVRGLHRAGRRRGRAARRRRRLAQQLERAATSSPPSSPTSTTRRHHRPGGDLRAGPRRDPLRGRGRRGRHRQRLDLGLSGAVSARRPDGPCGSPAGSAPAPSASTAASW